MSGPSRIVMAPAAPGAIGIEVWIGLGVGAAALLGAAILASRRARERRPGPSGRFRRVAATSTAFMVTLTLMYLPFGWLHETTLARLGLQLAVPVSTLLAGGLVVFGIMDLLVGFAEARRTKAWLAAAPFIFLTLLVVAAGVPTLLTQAGPELNLRQIMLVQDAIAASLVWWSFLPAPERTVGGVFE